MVKQFVMINSERTATCRTAVMLKSRCGKGVERTLRSVSVSRARFTVTSDRLDTRQIYPSTHSVGLQRGTSLLHADRNGNINFHRRQIARIGLITSTMTVTEGSDEAAEARKKRKAILIQRHEELNGEKHSESGNEGGRSMSVASATSSDAASHQEEGEPGAKKIKKSQIRYDPAVPMNKEELANWRREHRRVRNRESAAASRQRIRTRISELEGEVTQWKEKYYAAVQRLNNLRGATGQDAQQPPAQPPNDAST